MWLGPKTLVLGHGFAESWVHPRFSYAGTSQAQTRMNSVTLGDWRSCTSPAPSIPTCDNACAAPPTTHL